MENRSKKYFLMKIKYSLNKVMSVISAKHLNIWKMYLKTKIKNILSRISKVHQQFYFIAYKLILF